MEHLAILLPEYLDAALDGRKRIESRLAKTRQAPYGKVAPRDRVFLKERGGRVRAIAAVEAVEIYDNLTPQGIDRIREACNHLVLGTDAYWESKKHARCATLIWFESVRKIRASDAIPTLPGMYGAGWRVLGPAQRTPGVAA